VSWYQKILKWVKACEIKWNKLSENDRNLSFSDFAFNELQNHSFHIDFKIQDVVLEILNLDTYPNQFSPLSNFGEPPITLFMSSSSNFILEIYIWNDFHTMVHDHSFEGAFTILHGQSIETEYDFNSEQTLGIAHLGVLNKKNFFHLTPGDVRKIKRGNQFIHKVIHISKPTVSMVLRTYNEVGNIRQFGYHFNNLASPSFPEKNISGKLRVLNWYLENNLPISQRMINSLLPYSGFWEILASKPHTKIIVTKLARVLNRTSILKSMNNENIVLNLLRVLESDEDRICLALLEFFEPQSFEDFRNQLDKAYQPNFPKLNLESFKENLLKKIESESITIKNSLLELVTADQKE
jgi:hypothetical protein